MVRRREQRTIIAGGLNMLQLNRRSSDVRFPRDCEFLWPRLRDNSSRSAIVADVVRRLIHSDIFDVNICNAHICDIVDGAIVKEISIIPVSTLVADAGIAKSISHAAIEPYVRSPIPFMEHINTIVPAPVSWRPK
jgi:hypothetical protein